MSKLIVIKWNKYWQKTQTRTNQSQHTSATRYLLIMRPHLAELLPNNEVKSRNQHNQSKIHKKARQIYRYVPILSPAEDHHKSYQANF